MGPFAELSLRLFPASDRSRRERLNRTVELARTLLTTKGELGGVRVATSLASAYRELGPEDEEDFFTRLVTDFGPDEARARAAAEAYLADSTPESASRLAAAAEAPRQELIRRLNMAPGGAATILRMRERVLALLPGRPELSPLASDLRHLLASWFNRGFLELRQIDWDTPASVLEKLIRYEAVHAIRGWDDLRRRVQGDRRCFGFFHPALPDEPLIFVEVALTETMGEAIAPLLAPPQPDRPPKAPRTAVFYSISNCQPGLKNVHFGNFLIKQVVADLAAEFRTIETFATLSPVPGFRRWLETAQAEKPVAIATLLNRPDWPFDAAAAEALRGPLLTLCARYLTGLKADGSPGGTIDPVARFHLSNGARLERINWSADLSEKGLAESWGLMVNYRYLPRSIEANHEAFMLRGEIARSREIGLLAAASTVQGGAARFTLLPGAKRAKPPTPGAAEA